MVGCGFEGLTCSHYLSRLGYQVALLDEATDYRKTEVFTKYKDLPDEVKQRELSDIMLPSTEFKGNFIIKDANQLTELSSNYHAVYITKQLEGKRPENGLAQRLKNVVVETTDLSDPKNSCKVAYAIEKGRKAAMKIHFLLQKEKQYQASALKPEAG